MWTAGFYIFTLLSSLTVNAFILPYADLHVEDGKLHRRDSQQQQQGFTGGFPFSGLSNLLPKSPFPFFNGNLFSTSSQGNQPQKQLPNMMSTENSIPTTNGVQFNGKFNGSSYGSIPSNTPQYSVGGFPQMKFQSNMPQSFQSNLPTVSYEPSNYRYQNSNSNIPGQSSSFTNNFPSPMSQMPNWMSSINMNPSQLSQMKTPMSSTNNIQIPSPMSQMPNWMSSINMDPSQISQMKNSMSSTSQMPNWMSSINMDPSQLSQMKNPMPSTNNMISSSTNQMPDPMSSLNNMQLDKISPGGSYASSYTYTSDPNNPNGSQGTLVTANKVSDQPADVKVYSITPDGTTVQSDFSQNPIGGENNYKMGLAIPSSVNNFQPQSLSDPRSLQSLTNFTEEGDTKIPSMDGFQKMSIPTSGMVPDSSSFQLPSTASFSSDQSVPNFNSVSSSMPPTTTLTTPTTYSPYKKKVLSVEDLFANTTSPSQSSSTSIGETLLNGLSNLAPNILNNMLMSISSMTKMPLQMVQTLLKTISTNLPNTPLFDQMRMALVVAQGAISGLEETLEKIARNVNTKLTRRDIEYRNVQQNDEVNLNDYPPLPTEIENRVIQAIYTNRPISVSENQLQHLVRDILDDLRVELAPQLIYLQNMGYY